MAIPGTLHRVVYGGDLTAAEHFAFGFYFSNPTAVLADALSAANSWLSAFFVASFTVIGGTGTMTKAFMPLVAWKTVHVAQINPLTGKQTGPGVTGPASGVGTGTGASLPFQSSHCVTLLAGNQPGLRRRRNRFYLPPYVTTLMDPSTSRYVAAVGTQVAAAIKTCDDAMNAGTPGARMCVYSLADKEAFDATEIYLGDVVDTQRRRRRSLVESRTILALT